VAQHTSKYYASKDFSSANSRTQFTICLIESVTLTDAKWDRAQLMPHTCTHKMTLT